MMLVGKGVAEEEGGKKLRGDVFPVTDHDNEEGEKM